MARPNKPFRATKREQGNCIGELNDLHMGTNGVIQNVAFFSSTRLVLTEAND